ncbi:hypothetical protein BKA62DRAFT_139413 [Auriculariales sp. MPI-PUGE-AT-0066]|nr:hypothetical protein BKA62DRAFT_139413 [Auriculariales sp. MPI-PUGE-AT-0066]
MSIDLDWTKLDASLATRLVDALNRTISAMTRPSFIGPVAVTALDFGTVAPDIEIIDIRDVYRDFTEDDDYDSVQSEPQNAPRRDSGTRDELDEEDFEWVSRRAAAKVPPAMHAPFPSHMGHTSGPGPSMDFQHFFNGPGVHSPTASAAAWRHMQFQAAMADRAAAERQEQALSDTSEEQTDHEEVVSESNKDAPPAPSDPPPSHNPDLQLHLYVRHESDIRITITTSLLINYPSPMFMALPIKLSVTGLIFTGQVVVAYEGSRKRVHICIVDELDPYGPAHDFRRPITVASPEHAEGDNDDTRQSKRLPIGQRLLPSIFIESEIGQTDKHVLRNVTRVEKFMQEVIRKTIEDELVFPNFHTLDMQDAS